MKQFRAIVFVLVMTMGLVPVSTAKDRRPDIDTIEKVLVEQQRWLHNTIGITEKVPPPWTAMKVRKDDSHDLAVDMLGRSYRFHQSLFPSRIETWGRQILAGPINLTVVRDRQYPIHAEGLRLTKALPAAVELMAFGGSEGIDFFVTHHIEYDGMILTKVAISPTSGPVNVERIYLEIPIKKSLAKHLDSDTFAPPINPLGIQGLMPTLPFKSPFRPSLWFGDENVGLTWFAESDRGWDRRANLDRQMEVFDRGDSRVLRLNFILSPCRLDASRELAFGLMATPAKPLPKNWRTNPAIFTPTFSDFSWDKGSYYPEPKPELVKSGDFFKYIHDRTYFKTSFNYFAATFEDGIVVPEYYLFSRIWENLKLEEKERLTNPQPPEVNLGPTRGTRFVNEHQGSPLSGQADWLIWKWDGLIKKYKIRNVYFDSLGGLDINRLHGAGYVDENGELRPTLAILAMRRAVQRFYVMMWQNLGEDFTIMLHGGSSLPPMLAFAHARLDGEGFISEPRRVEAHYSDIVPDEEWEGHFMGKQYGVVGVFLPELTARNSIRPEPTKEMIMLATLREIPIIAAFCNSGLVKQTQKVLSDYGMQNLDFIPYWANGDYLGSSNAKIKVSLYFDRQSRKRMLLIVANPTRQHQRVTLDVKMPDLADGKKATARDLLFGEAFAVKERKFSLGIKELDFRLIAISHE